MTTTTNMKKTGAQTTTNIEMPTASSLAARLGVKLTKPLTTEHVRRLLKALPGYVSHLDDAADQLKEDAAVLGLSNITPDWLMQTKARAKQLMAIEPVIAAVQRSIHEQRMQVDSDAIGALFKIARRVNALAEDDPGLLDRWEFLIKFLDEFRNGGRKATVVPSHSVEVAISSRVSA